MQINRAHRAAGNRDLVSLCEEKLWISAVQHVNYDIRFWQKHVRLSEKVFGLFSLFFIRMFLWGCYHLPFDTAGGFSLQIWGGCAGLFCLIGKPEVRGLAEAAGHTQESAWTHLVCCRLSRGREERTGASVSANLVGRWLTSRCPSKCDLGHTFNEIHSTWQAPPLPGPSV